MKDEKTASPKCQRCGTPLAPDAPEGLCPRCLMALNLASQTEAPTAEAGPGGTRVVPPPTPPVEEIARLFPQLEIVECLGRGGMGIVYKARQPRLDRWVALKIISPGKEKDPHFSERFAREARALAHLSHQSIVTIYDFGEAGSLFYLLMEYVDGVSLRSLLQTRKLAPDAALKIVPAICEALQYAHQQGVVHRDIKPENILMDKSGRVKIADFGIAKMLGEESPAERLTGDRQVVGTPNYMAPEQVEKPAAVDHRADIYSLGVVFYEMLTGELPLGKFQPPSNKVHIDVRLDEIVLHALEKEPERRYQQAVEVKTALETLGEPAAPPPINTPRPAAPDPWAQVRGPANGLIVTAILNWVLIPLIFMGTVAIVSGMDLAKIYVLLVPLSAFVSSGIILLAALKMKALEARRLAIAGSVLAMLVSPGNIVGLPVGIWALVTLFRRETREAFAARAARKLGPAPARPSQPRSAWGWVAGAIAALILLLVAVPVGGILLSIALPAFSRAREVARGKALPTFVVKGVVTDDATGLPINRARVADNFYGTRPNRAPQEAWTDDTGHYELKTWNEEHTIAASAPGYETRLKTLITAPLGRATSATLDFTLKSVPASEPTVTPSTGAKQPAAEATEPLSGLQPGTATPAANNPASLSAPIPTEPQVLRVAANGSGTHTSIQAAIDAATDGAIIHVAPGRYEAPLVINKSLTLVGDTWQQTFVGPLQPRAEPPAETQRDFERRFNQARTDAERQQLRDEYAAAYEAPALLVKSSKPVVIAGLRFTLPGLPPEGRLLSSAVVKVAGGKATFRDCAIVGSPGNGLSISQGATVTVTNCLVAAAWNTGIQIDRSPSPGTVTITDTDIRNCHYAGVRIGDNYVLIQRCRISGAAWHGIRYDGTSPLITDNLIFSNARSGIYASGSTAAQVRGNVFWKNEMNGFSAWYNNRDLIRNNTFAENRREGLSVLGASEPDINHNIFWSNPTALFVGDIGDKSSSAKASGRLNLRDSLFWTNANNLVFSGAAIVADPSITNRFVLANFAGCREQDPHFRDPSRGDFSAPSGTVQGAGALRSLLADSPWPLQPEEKAIIPDGDTRDSRAWKRPSARF